MIRLTLLFFVSLLLQDTSGVQVIEKETFKALMDEGYQVVDVRRPDEFKAGHIAKAKNINFLGKRFVRKIARLDKSKPVMVYCRSGRRSARASKLMDSLGFQKIYDLKGGYLEWTAQE